MQYKETCSKLSIFVFQKNTCLKIEMFQIEKGIFEIERNDRRMSTFGYARVSTQEQNLERQLIALREFGIEERFIFMDKASGKDFHRKQWNALVGTEETASLLREGDLLVVYSIDRLGRNYNEILQQWKYITKELKANIKVLDMPLLDTSKDNGNLESTFIADLVLQILSYVSQKERDNIKARQRQGINAMPIVDGKRVSSKTGKPVGRPAIAYPEEWESYYKAWKGGEITAVKAMQELGLKKNSFYKLVRRYEQA